MFGPINWDKVFDPQVFNQWVESFRPDQAIGWDDQFKHPFVFFAQERLTDLGASALKVRLCRVGNHFGSEGWQARFLWGGQELQVKLPEWSQRWCRMMEIGPGRPISADMGLESLERMGYRTDQRSEQEKSSGLRRVTVSASANSIGGLRNRGLI